MSKHIITIGGCDDSTKMRMELTDAERYVIERLLAHLNELQIVGCKPYGEIADGTQELDEWSEVIEVDFSESFAAIDARLAARKEQERLERQRIAESLQRRDAEKRAEALRKAAPADPWATFDANRP